MLQKTCCDYCCNLFLFLTLGYVTKPNSQSSSEFLHTKTELWGCQKQNASLVLKLLPIFIVITSCRAQSSQN